MLPLGTVNLPDEPELQKVLQQIVSAVNSLRTPNFTAGPGIRVTNAGDSWHIAAHEEPLFETRSLYPRLVKDGAYLVVGLSPGWVIFQRDSGTSKAVIPYIGVDEATGVKINENPPPGIDKVPGTYYTRLTLEGEESVKVEFVLTSDTPATDNDYLIINKFKLAENSGIRHLQVLEVYVEQPILRADRLSNLLFWCKRSLPPVTVSTIDISVQKGYVYRPAMAYPNTGGHMLALIPAERILIPSTVKSNIVEGDSLWVKITWTGDDADPNLLVAESYGMFRIVSGANELPIDVLVTETADLHTHDITISQGTGEGDFADVAVAYKCRGIVMLTATFEIYNAVDAAALVDDRETTYVKIASFTVVGTDILTITQEVAGCPLIAYPLIYTFGRALGD